MLKFIDENDFVLVDTFQLCSDNSVEWSYISDSGSHTGVIYEGLVCTTSIQDGTTEVSTGFKNAKVGETPVLDEEGNPVLDDNGDPVTEPVYESQEQFETVPNMVDVEINVWDKLQELHADPDSPVTILPVPQSVLDEESLNTFRSSRATAIQTATVTTTAGNCYDANEIAQERMNRAITAASVAGMDDNDTLSWSLNSDPTGVMSTVTIADLKEAFVLSVQQMTTLMTR